MVHKRLFRKSGSNRLKRHKSAYIDILLALHADLFITIF